MINNYKKPEILAPCGSYDIMIAAINAGADACYFGGYKFGARAYATNFDLETSLKAIDYAHIHGTSLYLTVNTLFKDNEIKALYDYLLPYYKAGLDAVIVQDFGVFKYIKEMFSDMHIHCSTQMNINSKHAALGMKNLGASRVVTARELTLDEIAHIKDTVDIEIESFVHGAMCYSYSGRCLMSSLAGGRSGNRGRCAQPCRKCYDGEYILSMKDMCTLTDVPMLIDAGIDSLKIEGRMKNEYYVASAVDAYNQIATDVVEGCYNEKKAVELKYKLANIYNRGGFCDGYYFIQGGPDMISKDRPNNQGIELGKVIYAKNGEIGLKLYEDLYKQDVIELKLKTDSFIIDGKAKNNRANDSLFNNKSNDNYLEITSGIEGKRGSQVSLKCPKTKYIAVGSTALRTRCNYILEDVKANIIDKNKDIDIVGEFTAKIGRPMSFKLSRDVAGECIAYTAYADEVQEARDKATDIGDVRRKLSQLGNTCYSFNKLSLDIDANAFVPAGVVKKLRREAIEGLEQAVCDIFKRVSRSNSFVDENVKLSIKSFTDKNVRLFGDSFTDEYVNQSGDSFIDNNTELFSYALVDKAANSANDYCHMENSYKVNVSISNYEQLLVVTDFSYIDGIILGLDLYERALKDKVFDKLTGDGLNIYLDTPYVTSNSFDIAAYLQCKGISGIYIRNVDTLFAYVDYMRESTGNTGVEVGINTDEAGISNDNNVAVIDQAYGISNDEFKVICTNGVYAYNNKAREFISALIPNVIFELPKELNKSELNELAKAIENSCRDITASFNYTVDKGNRLSYNNQLSVYEYQQVMVSNQCVVKNKSGCNRSNQCMRLKDDRGNTFYAMAICEECINVIYNGVPSMLLGQLDKRLLDSFRVSYLKIGFTIEDKDKVEQILNLVKAFIEADYNGGSLHYHDNAYTAGHFNRGVE